MTLGNRLKEERERLGMTQPAIAAVAGVAKNTQILYETDRRSPKADYLTAVLEAGVDVTYVLTGRRSGVAAEPLAAYAVTDDVAQIPLYDIEAAAGHGQLFDEEKIVGHLPYRRDELARAGLIETQLVALRVKGDSMFPTLNDGDTVIVNRANRKPDGVFLVRVGEALRIKRVQKMMAGCLRLSSDNDHYAPEVISPDQVDGFEIIGSVVERSGRVL